MKILNCFSYDGDFI